MVMAIVRIFLKMMMFNITQSDKIMAKVQKKNINKNLTKRSFYYLLKFMLEFYCAVLFHLWAI